MSTPTGRFIFLRHGQTSANIESALDTRPPGRPLTDRGVQQARDAGVHLATITGVAAPQRRRLAAVVNSTALRAQQTAAAAMEQFNDKIADSSVHEVLAPVTIGGIHEISAGIYEDQSTPEAINAYVSAFRAMLTGDERASVEGGETLQEFLGRYKTVVEVLGAQYGILEETPPGDEGVDVLIVSHGAAIRVFTALATGCGPQLITDHYLDNCYLSIIEPAGKPFGQWRLRHWAGIDMG